MVAWQAPISSYGADIDEVVFRILRVRNFPGAENLLHARAHITASAAVEQAAQYFITASPGSFQGRHLSQNFHDGRRTLNSVSFYSVLTKVLVEAGWWLDEILF